MEINFLFFITVVPAIILYGIAKSGLSGSMALISIPLMTVVMPLGQALAIVLPILILSDMVAVYRFRKNYDLQTLKKEVSRDHIKNSKVDGLWRYSPLLPVLDPKDRVTLGETITPLIQLNRTVNYSSEDKGVVLVKDEGRLPTGSFKARGLCLAVSMAKQFKLKHLAIPTNGNAGAAMAAYATNAGIKSTVFCPEDTPDINIREIDNIFKMIGAQHHENNGRNPFFPKDDSPGWIEIFGTPPVRIAMIKQYLDVDGDLIGGTEESMNELINPYDSQFINKEAQTMQDLIEDEKKSMDFEKELAHQKEQIKQMLGDKDINELTEIYNKTKR